MRLFFVDFENVLSGGMMGVCNINTDDKVFLFYTTNSNKLEFKLYEELLKAPGTVQLIEVTTGNNSLDFQLSSYLGSFVPNNKKAQFIIVSKDKGFDAVVDFWSKRDISIKRVNNMDLQDNASLNKELEEKLPEFKKDIPDIIEMLTKYKTKQGLNNALTKKYGTQKTGVIYKSIKSYIK